MINSAEDVILVMENAADEIVRQADIIKALALELARVRTLAAEWHRAYDNERGANDLLRRQITTTRRDASRWHAAYLRAVEGGGEWRAYGNEDAGTTYLGLPAIIANPDQLTLTDPTEPKP